MTPSDREWLVTDGLGGFGSGTAGLVRTRREHALLVAASPEDERRWALVSGLDVSVERESGRVALSSHLYAPDVTHPDGASRVAAFAAEPWPTWRFSLGDGVEIVHEAFMPRGRAATFISWRLVATHEVQLRLHVRPLLAMRALRELQRENGTFTFDPARVEPGLWLWQAYERVPPLVVHADGEYRHDPVWYRQFIYPAEASTGEPGVEDLASPGTFVWTLRSLSQSRAEMMVSVPESWGGYHAPGELAPIARAVRDSERARIAAYRSRLFHSADAFVISEHGGARQTIVPTYPPDDDRAPREVFASLRGLCLVPNRLDEAEHVLTSWAPEVVAMAAPDGGREGRCASVDAPLWFVVAVQEFLTESARRGHWIDEAVPRRLTDACQEVLEYFARGTHSGIRMTDDGLLAAGAPGTALTWMDARIDGTPVTPRVGKPVEVQALWINALTVGSKWSERWADVGEQATQSFVERFWNEERQCLNDVVDVDHVAGAIDSRIRPSQLLAVGGLPSMTIGGERARLMVATVERLLWTPMGLRTLDVGDPDYIGRYEGDDVARARAAHRGTVWPWLTGAFVDAWVRVRAAERAAGSDRVPVGMLRALRMEARQKFLRTLARQLDSGGIGHLGRMADGDAPHLARGAVFCGWSLGEVGRVMTE